MDWKKILELNYCSVANIRGPTTIFGIVTGNLMMKDMANEPDLQNPENHVWSCKSFLDYTEDKNNAKDTMVSFTSPIDISSSTSTEMISTLEHEHRRAAHSMELWFKNEERFMEG